tara:strand:+ start:347 stop:1723 length:1377 start_codon:yes stop_codon:yes gene_type:complete
MVKINGGKVIASGGYGCVFMEALKCKGSSRRQRGKISKLMTVKHSESEYDEINKIKKKLDKIKNYSNYYLLNDINLCKPAKLTKSDLVDFKSKCSSLPKDNITKKNINKKLDQLMVLNMPYGGLPVDDYLDDFYFEKLHEVHVSLMRLLNNGIFPMNKLNIYHCDIKDSNVLVDESANPLKTRLIDWGLVTHYIPFKNNKFPKSWRNRPLQFNVPFSVIIFTDVFVEKYTKFIHDGGTITERSLKPFIVDYINVWIKERGKGHYEYINKMMFMLFSNDLTSGHKDEKRQKTEAQTFDIIVNYIVDVLVHFTRFRDDGTLNLREYVDSVFINIVDIWGFITIYYEVIDLLFDNYASLNSSELQMFVKLKFIIIKYLYTPRHEPIDVDMLDADFNEFGKLIKANLNNIKIDGFSHTKISSTPDRLRSFKKSNKTTRKLKHQSKRKTKHERKIKNKHTRKR